MAENRRSYRLSERGVSTVEYGALVALLIIAIIIPVRQLGQAASSVFFQVGAATSLAITQSVNLGGGSNSTVPPGNGGDETEIDESDTGEEEPGKR